MITANLQYIISCLVLRRSRALKWASGKRLTTPVIQKRLKNIYLSANAGMKIHQIFKYWGIYDCILSHCEVVFLTSPPISHSQWIPQIQPTKIDSFLHLKEASKQVYFKIPMYTPMHTFAHEIKPHLITIRLLGFLT